jgi:hypothetical protein
MKSLAGWRETFRQESERFGEGLLVSEKVRAAVERAMM